MSIFRPSNINKRLAGSAASPGNGGQIGPQKTPYRNGSLKLGCRCAFGCNGGVFKTNEAYCGIKECCKCPEVDYKGFFICCGPSTAKWFVSPFCAEVGSNWYSRGAAVTQANNCVGSCGWFVPTTQQMCNPGYTCRQYWDNYCCTTSYWGNCKCCPPRHLFSQTFNMGNGTYGQALSDHRAPSLRVRAFRCSAT